VPAPCAFDYALVRVVPRVERGEFVLLVGDACERGVETHRDRVHSRDDFVDGAAHLGEPLVEVRWRRPLFAVLDRVHAGDECGDRLLELLVTVLQRAI